MPPRFVDPTPFIPTGFNRIMIEGRRTMSRAIMGRQPRCNSDLAIAIIHPMPNHQVSFTGIRDVLDDFLRNNMRAMFSLIQPCPFGQAYVRFGTYYDRDRLIHNSPHEFGDVSISFIPHDQAWNHKRVNMNYEVWLMFLGLNVDHWNNHLVDKALYDWGRLVLQTRILGEAPTDEDDPPEGPDDVNPNLFDFFGFGQPSQGPPQPPNVQDPPNAADWGLWPDQIHQMQPMQNQCNEGPNQAMDGGNLVNINQQNLEDDAQVQDGNGIDLNVRIPEPDNLGTVENMPVEVEVFIPLANGVPLQIMPDEINEDDLLGDGPNDQGLGQQVTLNEMAEQGELNHMQLGFVHVEAPLVDPVLESIATGSFTGGTLPVNFYRFWSKHFSPGDSQQFTKIAPERAAFFTAALLNPASFEWAKHFLTSPAWEYFTHASAEDFSFVLPAKCPSKTSPSCLAGNGEDTSAMVEAMVDATLDEEENEETEVLLEEQVHGNDIGSCETPQNVSPSTRPWSKDLLTKAGKPKISENDPSLRRSCRQKGQNKGFKGTVCKDKQCFACDSRPPNISPSIIKNLRASFCDIDPENLSQQALNKKKKPSAPEGKKVPAKEKSKESVDNDEHQDKNAKKKASK
ncbi:hypothetical protein HU200_008706 [Digitaria exilis]|uniref:DUF7597 domain-containing protein n=1 Tax=Digitaria exilis TaxID=1010633 RepID=A0A835KRG9_9POAL|nr:hypothetical protein HU200_008706 [Digitaria exilis]